MIATPANMERLRREAGEPICAPGVFALDAHTGDRFSASPGDYFWMPDDEPLRDVNGDEMILCTATETITEVGAP